MPHKTWAIGEEVIQTDFQSNVADQIVAVYASAAARSAGWASPPEGALSYLTDNNLLAVYNGSAWVTITPVSAATATTETRTASSYGDLTSGANPAVSIQTGTKALVTMSANINNSGGTDSVYMSVAVSGATTLAASDAWALSMTGPSGAQQQAAYTAYFSSLTAGTNTFTAKYRAASGTITGSYRVLTVVGIP